MTEADLYEQVAQYLNLKHRGVLYHFDTSGIWTPSHKARNLYGRLNQRAFPDLFLGAVRLMPGTDRFYGGLFIELKKEGTRLRKRDGSWASEHIEEQAHMLDMLGRSGYCAVWGIGFEDAVRCIESYLSGVQLERAA